MVHAFSTIKSFRIAALTLLPACLLIFAGCGALDDSGGRSSDALVRGIIGVADAPRIEFNDFFGRLIDGGRTWAGDKLRIGRISVGPAGSAGRLRGAAPVWLATIVRCDREEEVDGADKDAPPIKVCSGESRQVVMSNLNIGGYGIGFDLGKEESFFGSAVKPSRIKIAAAEAQRLADAAMGSKGVSGEYVYELTVRREDSQPLWRVRKDCDAALAAGNRCSLSDRWVVELEAETGKIVSQENLND